MLSAQSKTNDGASWLSLALQGTGSFRFVLALLHPGRAAGQSDIGNLLRNHYHQRIEFRRR